MAMAEMVAKLGLDSSGFIAPIEEAIAKLNSLAAESQASFQKLAASTAPAESAAKNLAATQEQSSKSASQAVEKQHTSLIGFALKSTGVLALFASGIALFDPKFKKYALGLSLISIAHKIYQATIGASYEAARKAHAAMSEKPKEASAKSSEPMISSNTTQSIKDLSTTMMGSAGVWGKRAFWATLAYKAGLDEVAAASVRHLSLDSAMMKSITGVSSSFINAAQTGFDMFAEGVKGSSLAVIQAITGFGDLTELVDFGAAKITQAAKFIGSGMTFVADNARELGLQIGAFLGSVQSRMSPLGDGMFNTQRYIEEGRELNKLIEQSKLRDESQAAQTNALKTIKDAEESAGRSRQLAVDKARIGSIQTVTGIDAEIQSLKVKQAFVDKDAQKSREYLKYIGSVTQALENQRTAILANEAKPEDATAQSEAAKAYESAQQNLMKLQMGQEAYARSAIMAMDATDDEVIALLALHDQTVALEAARKQQQKTDQLFAQGANKITDMRDQIDLLTGAATTAEIEMRKLSRAGYDEGQIEEIGKLTEQLDALRAKDKTGGGGLGKTLAASSKASYAGSSETASLFLRGVGGQDGGVQQKQLKTQVDMLTELQAMNSRGPKSTTSVPTANFA